MRAAHWRGLDRNIPRVHLAPAPFAHFAKELHKFHPPTVTVKLSLAQNWFLTSLDWWSDSVTSFISYFWAGTGFINFSLHPLTPTLGSPPVWEPSGRGRTTARPTTVNCAWRGWQPNGTGGGISRNLSPKLSVHFFLPPERAESPLDFFPADKENGALAVSSSFLLAVGKKTSNKPEARYSMNILMNTYAAIVASSVEKLVNWLKRSRILPECCHFTYGLSPLAPLPSLPSLSLQLALFQRNRHRRPCHPYRQQRGATLSEP